jgi:hypothetical protein
VRLCSRQLRSVASASPSLPERETVVARVRRRSARWSPRWTGSSPPAHHMRASSIGFSNQRPVCQGLDLPAATPGIDRKIRGSERR